MAIENTSVHEAVPYQKRHDSIVQIANLVVHRISDRRPPPRRAKRARLRGPCAKAILARDRHLER